MKKCFFLFLSVFLPGALFAQVVWSSGASDPVYSLLDELAGMKAISLNSAVLPLSRNVIAEKLYKASLHPEFLTPRQNADLQFFLREYAAEIPVTPGDTLLQLVGIPAVQTGFGYNPPGYDLLKKNFSLSIRPLIGLTGIINQNGSVTKLQGGGKLFGSLGKHLGFYFKLVQTRESEPIAAPVYFTPEPGSVWTTHSNGVVTNTEWTGGISCSWKWGDISIRKDRPVWGEAEHGSNILSGREPSVPFLQLHVKPAGWIEFSYIHGQLNSETVDSSRSTFDPGSEHIVYQKKYLAANLLTVFPWKSLSFSAGNSIVYNEDGFDPVYFIPVLFFKSVDQTFGGLNSTNGQNNQLFFTLSWRGIRHLHLYTSVFIDDFKMKAFLSKGQHNEMSLKAGFKLSGFPFRNISLSAEYTRTNPMTYRHYVESITYSSDGYCLGNYLGDNAHELFVRLDAHPLRGLNIYGSWVFIEHGEQQTNLLANNYTMPVLQNIIYHNNTFVAGISYEILHETLLFAEFMHSENQGDVKFYPSVFHGTTNSCVAGFRVGF